MFPSLEVKPSAGRMVRIPFVESVVPSSVLDKQHHLNAHRKYEKKNC
jgi:hypothetical protein